MNCKHHIRRSILGASLALLVTSCGSTPLVQPLAAKVDHPAYQERIQRLDKKIAALDARATQPSSPKTDD